MVKNYLAMRMRVTSVTYGILAFCCSLLMAQASHAQAITINERNASITDIFKTIEKQAGVQFTYNEQTVEGLSKITLKISGKPLQDVLNAISEKLPLQFKLSGNLIGVLRKEKKTAPLPSAIIPAENTSGDISGRVIDNTGTALPGATLRVKGSGISTLSDNEGKFRIKNVQPEVILVVSYVSYKTREIPVNEPTTDLDVILEQDDSKLQEVAVVSTGYQRLPKERATGSFATVSSEKLSERVSSDLISRLEGITPSFLIPNKNIPVGANESPFTVRGRSTIFANTKPLVVVDNFPYDGDISNINPNDIENVTVLKDAAAASIWGAFSGNGVLVITTRKGKLNDALQENYEQLKEQLYRKGFGESLNKELEQKLKSGESDFFLEQPSVKIKDDEMAYKLNFRRDDDPEKDKVYLNSFDAMLFKSPDLQQGETRQHNFSARQLISATEAHRMLKYGELVAVNKDLYNKEGQSYNTWLSLDTKGAKDEYGNYPVNSYHENYYKKEPFDLANALKGIPVPIKYMDNPKIVADFEKSLKKANLVTVTIKAGDGEQQAYLSVDPRSGKVNLLDQQLQKMDLSTLEQKKQAIKNSSAEQSPADEKKKTSGQQQKVSWNKPPQKRQGLSH